jgi:hypothetical protein
MQSERFEAERADSEGRERAELKLELERAVLCTGQTLAGTVVLDLPQPARVRRLWVQAAGRELVKTHPRYAPAVYRHPVPRPFGRTRSGALQLDYLEQQPLLGPMPPADVRGRWADTVGSGEAVTVPQGRSVWPFSLTVPETALPTYGGASVTIEHEVVAVAQLADGSTLDAWAPIHVWRAEPPSAAAAEPLEITAPEPSATWLDRLADRHRAPLSFRFALDSVVLGLTDIIHGRLVVDNPHNLTLKHLVLELTATETTRHMAATDVTTYMAARRLLPLPTAPRVDERVDWALPPRLAPTLRSERLKLDWRLHVAVTVPWQLGVTASAPLRLVDRLAGESCRSGQAPTPS